MLILSRVCAEFRDKSGAVIFNIPPSRLMSFLDAPEEIQADPLFRMLMEDGSLEAVRSVDQQRELEADPAAGITAEGKKPSPKAAAPAPVSDDSAPTALKPEPTEKGARKAEKK